MEFSLRVYESPLKPVFSRLLKICKRNDKLKPKRNSNTFIYTIARK